MNSRKSSEKEYQGIHAEDEFTDVDGTADTGVDGKIAALLVALMVRCSTNTFFHLFLKWPLTVTKNIYDSCRGIERDAGQGVLRLWFLAIFCAHGTHSAVPCSFHPRNKTLFPDHLIECTALSTSRLAFVQASVVMLGTAADVMEKHSGHPKVQYAVATGVISMICCIGKPHHVRTNQPINHSILHTARSMLYDCSILVYSVFNWHTPCSSNIRASCAPCVCGKSQGFPGSFLHIPTLEFMRSQHFFFFSLSFSLFPFDSSSPSPFTLSPFHACMPLMIE